MSPSVAQRYSLEEYKQIDLECQGLTLSSEVLETLKLIETQIIIPTDEPLIESRGIVSRRRGGGARTSFQVTKRTEVGVIDKQFNDIRAMINKLSTKNVENQKPIVLDAIAKFIFDLEEDVRDPFVRKITDILVSNPFLVKVYVDIYTDLCLPEFPYHDEFLTLINHGLVDEYMASLRKLQSVVESSEDYDKFCEYNKCNDNHNSRRHTTIFSFFIPRNNIVPVFGVLNPFFDNCIIRKSVNCNGVSYCGTGKTTN